MRAELCKITITDQGVTRVYQNTVDADEALLSAKNAEVVVEEIEAVPPYLFSGKQGIASIHFGKGVVNINDGACTACKDLRKVSFDGCVAEIGNSSFSRCHELTDFTAAKGLRVIGDAAFLGCMHLSTISIQRGVVRIGQMAFAFCPSLKTFVCKADKQCAIAVNAFHGSLKDYTVRNSIAKLLNRQETNEFDRNGAHVMRVAKFKDRVYNSARQKEHERLDKLIKK